LFYIVTQQSQDQFTEEIVVANESTDCVDFDFQDVEFSIAEVVFSKPIRLTLNFEFQHLHKAYEKYDAQAVITGSFYVKTVFLKICSLNLRNPKRSNLFAIERNEHYQHNWRYYRAVMIKFCSNQSNFKSIDDCDDEEPTLYTIMRWSNRGIRHKIKYIDRICIGYDCETIQIDNKHVPYILCAQEFYPDDKNGTNDGSVFECYEWNRDGELGEKFINWIWEEYIDPIVDMQFNRMNTIILRLVGFNNFRFDDNFIIEQLRNIEGIQYFLNSRFGKVTQEIFYYKGIRIEICDMTTWLPDMSLKQACVDYEISTTKMDFDIVAYNQYCNDQKRFVTSVDTVDEMLKFMTVKNISTKMALKQKYIDKETKKFDLGRLVVDYCVRDVDTTIKLYMKIQDTFVSLSEKIKELSNTRLLHHDDFMKYWSIPQLANDIFRCFQVGEDGCNLLQSGAPLGQFMSESYFGGRVWMSCIGEYISSSKGGLEYQDVTSEVSIQADYRSRLKILHS